MQPYKLTASKISDSRRTLSSPKASRIKDVEATYEATVTCEEHDDSGPADSSTGDHAQQR